MSRLTEVAKILVILGPTASGKSELAVKLARRFKGEIISADSRQVYRGLDIGSGKVPRDRPNFNRIQSNKNRIRAELDEIREKFGRYLYGGIPHHLLDVASPRRTFTVVQYQRLAEKALHDILRRGKLPIICGGTGLYIDALLYGWKLPAVKPNLKLRKQLEKLSEPELFGKLKKLDPRRAVEIDQHNKRRLVRALEIVYQTGAPIPPFAPKSHSYVLKNVRMRKADILKIGITLPNEELKRCIQRRLLARIQQGMVEEVQRLHKSGVSWKRLDDLGLEYRYVSRHLRGLLNKEAMIELLEREIWRYAKRQITWWKRDKEIVWLTNEKGIIQKVQQFVS